MMIDLVKLLKKFNDINDFEFEGRLFKTNVPSVAPKAYLNILYKSADDTIQKQIDSFMLPEQVRSFYNNFNGANLLSSSIDISGFLPENYLLVRTDFRQSLPYNIADSNLTYSIDLKNDNIIVIGSYGYDRSRVYVEKSTGKIFCSYENNLKEIRTSWDSFDEWLGIELSRLIKHFDENGNRIVDMKETLPE